MNTNQSNTINVLPYTNDPAISADVKAFLKVLNSGDGAPLETLSPQEARAVLVGAQASVDVDYSGVDFSDKTIEADGYTIKLDIVKPEGNNDTLPVFIFIHGGGWVLGDFPTHKRMVRDLVIESGATGVFINYTPSPEARYPQAVNEIYAATKWVAENGASINVDGTRLAIVGNSVGGNMSTVTVLKALENNGPAIKAQILLWPIVAADFETASYKLYGADRFLTTPLMEWLYDQYTTDPVERAQVYASPLNATTAQLKGMPPTFIHVAEADVLRDEGEAYGRKLDEAGVSVTTIRYNGTIHDFGLLNGLANIPQTKALFANAGAELKKYL